MTTAIRTRKKTAPPTPILPELPADLTSWRWAAHPSSGEYALQAPDGAYTTKMYKVLDERPFNEARRWLKAQPKDKAASPGQNAAVAWDEVRAAEDPARAASYYLESAKDLAGHPMGIWTLVQAAQAAACVRDDDASIALTKEIAGAMADELGRQGWSIISQGISKWELRNPEWSEALECDDAFDLVATVTYVQGHPTDTPTQIAAALASFYDTVVVTLPPAPAAPQGQPPADDGVFRRPQGVGEHITIRLGTIVPGRYQPRTVFAPESLAELQESIKEHGVLTRLKVFVNEAGDFELIAGERRWRAAQALGIEGVPVEVCELTLRQIHEISIIDNLQRADLTPVEEGQAYERMITELKVSEAELARRLGKPRTTIQARRAIASAAPAVQEALLTGAISYSQARGICAGAPGNEKAQQAALKTIKEQLASGRNIKEVEAQATAQQVVLKTIKPKLVELGWTGGEFTWGNTDQVKQIWVWAAGERPRQWTGAELQAAVREQRRPQGATPDTATITDHHERSWRRHGYYQYRDFAPWVVLSLTAVPLVLHPSEVPDLIAELDAQFAAMQARYQAASWTLEHQDGNSFRATSREGRREAPWMWKGVEDLIARIEAGKVSAGLDAPAKQKPVLNTCRGCQKKFDTNIDKYEYLDGNIHCMPCAKAIAKERKKRIEQRRKELGQTLAGWLEAAPRGMLDLLVARSTNYDNSSYINSLGGTRGIEDYLKAIDKLSIEQLRTAFIAQLADVGERLSADEWAARICLPGAADTRAVGESEAA